MSTPSAYAHGDAASPPPRARAAAILTWTVESWLRRTTDPQAGAVAGARQAPIRGEPWDVWWACTRAGMSAADLGIRLRLDLGLQVEPDTRRGDLVVVADCGRCVVDVDELTREAPADMIDPETWPRCCCPCQWAHRMREHPAWPAASAPALPAPSWRLQVAVVKPGTDPRQVADLLGRRYQVLHARERWLSDHDVHRLYPDAYGTEFRRLQNDYLALQPVHVLVLLAPARLTIQQHLAAKIEVRQCLGGNDVLRNHLHMADNPGDAWCDALHLLGPVAAQQLYRRYGA
jgi:hypothetical protein